MTDQEKRYSLCFLGPSSIGKTSIANVLAGKKFEENYGSTIGAEYHGIKIGDNFYNVWDTAGQENLKSLLPSYFRKADIIVIVFDLSNISSLKTSMEYYRYIIGRIDVLFYKKRPYRVILLGNKCDLIEGISSSEKDELWGKILEECALLGIDSSCKYISAKNNIGIDELKTEIINKTVGLLGSVKEGVDIENKKNASFWQCLV